MERILTDGEVEECWRAWKGDHHVELIRKVEEMVLAKGLPRPIYELRPQDYRPHTVTKLEEAGYLVVMRSDAAHPFAMTDTHPKQTPRTVTLSDGTKVWAEDGGIFAVHLKTGNVTRYPPAGRPLVYAFARTPEDAEALADLVRHPLEVR